MCASCLLAGAVITKCCTFPIAWLGSAFVTNQRLGFRPIEPGTQPAPPGCCSHRSLFRRGQCYQASAACLVASVDAGAVLENGQRGAWLCLSAAHCRPTPAAPGLPGSRFLRAAHAHIQHHRSEDALRPGRCAGAASPRRAWQASSNSHEHAEAGALAAAWRPALRRFQDHGLTWMLGSERPCRGRWYAHAPG